MINILFILIKVFFSDFYQTPFHCWLLNGAFVYGIGYTDQDVRNLRTCAIYLET